MSKPRRHQAKVDIDRLLDDGSDEALLELGEQLRSAELDRDAELSFAAVEDAELDSLHIDWTELERLGRSRTFLQRVRSAALATPQAWSVLVILAVIALFAGSRVLVSALGAATLFGRLALGIAAAAMIAGALLIAFASLSSSPRAAPAPRGASRPGPWASLGWLRNAAAAVLLGFVAVAFLDAVSDRAERQARMYATELIDLRRGVVAGDVPVESARKRLDGILAAIRATAFPAGDRPPVLRSMASLAPRARAYRSVFGLAATDRAALAVDDEERRHYLALAEEATQATAGVDWPEWLKALRPGQGSDGGHTRARH